MDRKGNVLAPMPVKAINISEFELFPESFAIFRKVVSEKLVSLSRDRISITTAG